ncbi:hypothetical protein [Duganella sp. Leaf126]|uniref:hypothetical protein n=1 Tax=Duganella sp. Leaf126 TaxID=1736266 RepID=UPI0009E7677C|nr:hypothetical protein [Duganella sp. Leaf126]
MIAKHFFLLAAAVGLAGCGNTPPAPDWKMTAHSATERFTSAYLTGNSRVEDADFRRAREALASTGQASMVLRAELTRCATRVAALVFEPCTGFDQLAQDASPADRAYAAYLAGRATAADAALLPEQHRAAASAASAGNDGAAATAVQAIADPLARLVASGVLMRAGKATPQTLRDAVDTASNQGWRRPLMAWLGVQVMRAQQAGDTQEAQRLQRRIDLAAGQPKT